MAQTYKKVVDLPLKPPDTSLALISKQLPENISWLPDGRGFQKRPGSLPFAYAEVEGDELNYMCALLSVQTPAAKLALYETIDETDEKIVANTLLGYRWGEVSYDFVDSEGWMFGAPDYARFGIFEFNPYRAFTINSAESASGGAQTFTRSRSSRSDSSYYFGNIQLSTAVVAADTVATVSALALPSASIYTDQGTLPVLTLSPEPQYSFSHYTDKKVFSVSRAETLSTAGSSYAPLNSMNVGRIDVTSDAAGTFIGGSGGPCYHYDGFRTHVSGAYPLDGVGAEGGDAVLFLDFGGSAAPDLAAGTYQYMMTHCFKLPTGETVEGVPTPIASITLSGPDPVGPSFDTTNGSGIPITTYAIASAYRMRAFKCSIATTTITIDSGVEGTVPDYRPGEKVRLFGSSVGASLGEFVVLSNDGAGTIVIDNPDNVTISSTTSVSANSWFRLYRTKADASTFYKVVDLSWERIRNSVDAQEAFYWDGIADSALVDAFVDTAFSRYSSPAVIHALTEHQGRLVALTTSSNSWFTKYSGGFDVDSTFVVPPPVEISSPTLIFSPASSKHYFSAENSFSLPTMAGENAPVALASVNDVLYIFLTSAIYYVQGTLGTTGEYSLNLLTNQLGVRDPRSVIVVNGEIFFMSDRGLIRISGTGIDEDFGRPVRKLLLEPGIITASYFWSKENLLLISANRQINVLNESASTAFDATVSHSNTALPYKYYSTIGKPRTLVYSMITRAWSIWNIECYNGAVESSGDLLCAQSNDISPIAGASSTITRYSRNCNWTDTGEIFRARYYSEWFDNGVPVVDKHYNRLALFSTDADEAGGQGFAATIRTERDWSPGDIVDEFEVNDFAGNSFGSEPYATTPYGDPERPYKLLALGNQRVKSLRVIIENEEPNGDLCFNATALETADSYENAKDYG